MKIAIGWSFAAAVGAIATLALVLFALLAFPGSEAAACIGGGNDCVTIVVSSGQPPGTIPSNEPGPTGSNPPPVENPCDVDPGSLACINTQHCSAIEADYLGGIHVASIAEITPVQLAFLNSVLAANGCPPVGAAPRLPTGEEIIQAVTRVAPSPVTVSGGDKYLVNAAVVFSALGPGGQSLNDVRLINIKLLGYTIQAQLHLVKTVWNWGDGSSDTFTEAAGQDLVGRRYSDAVPCESTVVCSKYISHVFTSLGSDTVAVTAFWTATVTIDGSAIVIPVTGGVSRVGGGKAIALVQARAVLVSH